MWPNYPGAEFVGTASIQVQRKEKFASLCLLDQHETLNFVISQWCLAENGKKGTKPHNALAGPCRVTVPLIKTY